MLSHDAVLTLHYSILLGGMRGGHLRGDALLVEIVSELLGVELASAVDPHLFDDMAALLEMEFRISFEGFEDGGCLCPVPHRCQINITSTVVNDEEPIAGAANRFHTERPANVHMDQL